MGKLPLTQDFDGTKLLGFFEMTAPGKKIFEQLLKVNDIDMVFAPSFIIKKQDKNGTIQEVELVSLSLIPAKNATRRSENEPNSTN